MAKYQSVKNLQVFSSPSGRKHKHMICIRFGRLKSQNIKYAIGKREQQSMEYKYGQKMKCQMVFLLLILIASFKHLNVL